MRILEWRPRDRKPVPVADPPVVCVPGAYAGRARFRPQHPSRVPPQLQPAIGRVVEVGVAGLARDGEQFAGQMLYLEWRRDDVFGGFLIPEQDLEFIDAAPRQRFARD